MTRTVGVEEEFLLLSLSSLDLAAAGDVVVAAAQKRSAGQFDEEFKREQAELGSSPHASMDELGRELRRRRSELALAARQGGARLLATGTSPLGGQVTTTAKERYERMTAQFAHVARAQLTCGMHVHVEVASPDEGIGVLDRIRDWLAVFVALSANSPFFAGEDSGYASYRSVLWGQWPTAGVADTFGSPVGYDDACQALITSGAALDDGMIYFDARLSRRYPTVEVRVADVCADRADAVTVAALIRAMVSTAADEWGRGTVVRATRGELLRAATWRAARYGTTQDLLDVWTAQPIPAWELVARLVEWVGPALLDAGDGAVVDAGLQAIRLRGTGAARQRAAYATGGRPALIDAVTVSTDPR